MKAADGLPQPRAELMPDQVALRNACVEFFESDVYAMAKSLGYRPQSVYGWIEGTRVPGRRVFQRLMRKLQLRSFSELWMPDPASVYFHGIRISPNDSRFREIEQQIAKTLRRSPTLAARLEKSKL